MIDDEFYILGVSSRADSFFKDVGDYGVDDIKAHLPKVCAQIGYENERS